MTDPRLTHESATTPDGEMLLSIATPAVEQRGAVVVVQEAFGVNGHIEDVTMRFADAGYLALAPHLFHRTGDPVIAYGEFGQVLEHAAVLSEAGLLADVDAALARIAAAGIAPQAVGIVGFCLGGTVAFLTAVRRQLGAAVTFYGGGVRQGRFGMPSQLELAQELQTPWLGLYGDNDTGIPVDDVEALRAAVAKRDVDTEIVRYGDAAHGFHCDQRPDYHPDSAADAWRRTLAWFDAHLAS
ncbi:MAG: dienelactone hydrolase family protein [Acidimicrobiales bacterium]